MSKPSRTTVTTHQPPTRQAEDSPADPAVVDDQLSDRTQSQLPPPVQLPEEEMLTLTDVARMVGRTAQTVGRWCNDGLLVCRRLPSGLRVVPRSEVMKFIGGSALATSIQG